MAIEVKLGVKDVAHNSLKIDDISHAAGNYEQRGGYAIEISNLIISVAQEGKRELIFSSKSSMGGRRICTNPITSAPIS